MVVTAVYVDVIIFVSRFVTEGEVVVVWWCDVITFSKLIWVTNTYFDELCYVGG